MYVHPEAKVGYYAHMRTGSTATKEWLLARGFVKVKGHHEPPWGWRRKPHQGIVHNNRWWWNQPQWEYQFYATVRNHYDICLSFKYWMKYEGEITDGWLDEYMYTRYRHLYCAHVLYPAFEFIPMCRTLYYENLRNDVNWMLTNHGLDPVTKPEARERANETKGKPHGSYREHLSLVERMVIERRFRWEMKQYGYEW